MTGMRLQRFVFACLACAFVSHGAVAQPSPPSTSSTKAPSAGTAPASEASAPLETPRTRALAEARTYLRASRYEDALPIYRRLYLEHAAPEVALELGLTEVRLRNHRDGAEHLALGLAAPEAAISAALLAQARAAFSEAKRHIGTLRIGVIPSGSTLTLNDSVLSDPLPPELFVTPGQYLLTASHAGFATLEQAFELQPGEERRIELALQALSVPAATSAAAPSQSPAKIRSEGQAPSQARPSLRPRTVVLVTGIGVAGAGLLATVFFAVRGTSAQGRADDLMLEASTRYGTTPCSSPQGAGSSTCRELERAVEDRVSQNRAANIALTVTGVAALSTLVLSFVLPRDYGDEVSTSVAPLSEAPLGLQLRRKF